MEVYENMQLTLFAVENTTPNTVQCRPLRLYSNAHLNIIIEPAATCVKNWEQKVATFRQTTPNFQYQKHRCSKL